jgi:hypothetical protein
MGGKEARRGGRNEIESQRSSSLLLPNDDGEDDFINAYQTDENIAAAINGPPSGITLSLSSKIQRCVDLSYLSIGDV